MLIFSDMHSFKTLQRQRSRSFTSLSHQCHFFNDILNLDVRPATCCHRGRKKGSEAVVCFPSIKWFIGAAEWKSQVFICSLHTITLFLNVFFVLFLIIMTLAVKYCNIEISLLSCRRQSLELKHYVKNFTLLSLKYIQFPLF